MRRFIWASLALAGFVVAPTPVAADFITGVSGVNKETGATVSAQANFSVSGDILTIKLFNTTGNTLNRGDVLTGLLFNVNLGPLPSLDLTSTTLTAGSLLFTGKSTSTSVANLNGSWTDDLSNSARFGIGASGFNGVFMAGTLTQGSGGTDFGIIGASTTFKNGFSSSAFPLVENSLTFKFSGATGITDSMFTDVKFLFGTSGAGIFDASGPTPAPAPSGLVVAAIAIGCLGAYCALRRKRPALTT